MILDKLKVLTLAKQEKPDDWIKQAQEDTHKLQMHVYGIGKDDYLQRVDTLESEDQFKQRKKFAPSNTATIEALFQPFTSVFTAKGTVIKYGLKSETLQDNLSKALSRTKGAMSDKAYLKDVWKYHFITDPNGLTFLEVKKDGSKAYLTHKSILDIKSMEVYGMIPEYVAFKEKEIEEGVTEQWIVDDVMFWKVIRKDGQYAISDESFTNAFGRVPGFVNSTITDTIRGFRISPIWKQIELLDKYLQNSSNKEIFIAKHGYPIFWKYAQYETQESESQNAYQHPLDQDNNQKFQTPRARTLKKDVTDGITITPPRSKEDPVVTPNVAGYVSPNIDGWTKMSEEQKETFDRIYHSLWGNYPIDKADGGKTATETMERVHATANKLNDFSAIVEKVHKQVIDLFGMFVAQNSYNADETVVSYSRRHILESPDALLKKYQEAKKNNVSESELDQMLINYYEGEYANNDMMLDYCKKLMMLDPFPHLTLTEVLSLPVSDELKAQKINMKQLKNDYTVGEILANDYKKLKEILNNYNQNNQNNERQNSEELETV